MKILMNCIIVAFILLSCEKHVKPDIEGNGEILRFNPEKCMCCWGWDLKIGNDTLKIDSIPYNLQSPYEITNPIPVYVELGPRILDCSNLNKYDYYKVIKIELLK
jgi:hypothetical protein